MDKDERAKRLRKAFRANGGIPLQFGIGQKVTGTEPIPNNGSGKPLPIHYGVSLGDNRPQWMDHADQPESAQLAIKRRTGPSPLLKIAARYSVRLERRA